MITAVEIENFKGIGERQRIELRPITLLFGPNSGGKSTVLHALLYAQEVICRRNLDADLTAAGGNTLDLGKFRSFVHDRNLANVIRLQFSFVMDNPGPSYIPRRSSTVLWNAGLNRADQAVDVDLELAIAWNRRKATPFVQGYEISVNQQPMAKIRCQEEQGYTELYEVNWSHDVFVTEKEASEIWSDLPELTWDISRLVDEEKKASAALNYMHLAPFERSEIALNILQFVYSHLGGQPRSEAVLEIDGQVDALPKLGKCIRLQVPQATPTDATDATNLADLSAILSPFIVGPIDALVRILQDIRYIGPIREAPARLYDPPSHSDPGRWANGLASWDLLPRMPSQFTDEVNHWLASDQRLNVGYSVQVRRFKELAIDGSVYADLISGRAFDDIDDLPSVIDNLPTSVRIALIDEQSKIALSPNDVGEGVIQVIPVVVALLDTSGKMLAVEQPELHVHPRVQVEIGDLLIESALHRDVKKQLVIETHSEHLILRLLKRIRETSDNKLPPGKMGIKPKDLAVYWVDLRGEGVSARSLKIDSEGEFVDRWPEGFFEERAEELF